MKSDQETPAQDDDVDTVELGPLFPKMVAYVEDATLFDEGYGLRLRGRIVDDRRGQRFKPGAVIFTSKLAKRYSLFVTSSGNGYLVEEDLI